MSKDYYKILGLEKGSSETDIKSAFRRLAREYHPDRGGDAQKFKEINEAYQVLGDAEKRQQYDQFGATFDGAGFQGGGPFGGFSQGGINVNMEDLGDVFGDFFNDAFGFQRTSTKRRAKRGADVQMELKIDFEEAVFGVEKNLEVFLKSKCEACKGTGSEDGKMVKCGVCSGHGVIQDQKRTIFGVIQTSRVCNKCGGAGEEARNKCQNCKGTGIQKKLKKLSVNIPAGIEDGEVLRLSGQGEFASGGAAGDLYLKINVKSSMHYKRKGHDIFSKISITFPEAALGASLDINTLDGIKELKIPSGIQSGEILAMRGLGVPISAGKRGDHLVEIIVRTPTKLNRKQKELLDELKKYVT